MRCVNRNHPDVVNLAKLNNYSPAFMADIIAVWQDNNNTDKIPSNDELGGSLLNEPQETVGKNNVSEKKLTQLLDSIGVKVEKLSDNNTESRFNTLTKIVSVVNGDKTAFEEETAHAFVEYLKATNNPLYHAMNYDIQKYSIFNDVVVQYGDRYKNNSELLADEAIGQAIAHYIGGKTTPLIKSESTINENESLLNRFARWFDKVVKFFQSRLNDYGIKSNEDFSDYFELTAKKILNSEFEGENWQSGRDVIFYNIKSFPKNFQELLNIHKKEYESISVKTNPAGKQGLTERYYDNTTGKFIEKRVSDLVHGKKNDDTKSEQREKEENINASWGSKVHDDLRALMAGDVNYSFQVPSVKLQLESLVKNIKSQFHKDSVYLTEQIIHDPKKGIAGTIDVLVYEPTSFDSNGNPTQYTTHILDYKLVEGLDSRFASGQMENRKKDYTIQLGEYIRILKEVYGINKIGQTRMLPINAVYEGKGENKRLSTVEVGNNKISSNEELDYLNPIPLITEQTNNSKINDLLDYLRDKLVKEKSKDRQRDIKLAIAKLQVSKEIKNANDVALGDRTRIEYLLNKAKINKLSNEELLDLISISDFYKDAIAKGYYSEESDEIFLTSSYTNQVYEEIQNLVTNHAFEITIDDEVIESSVIDINKPIKEHSWFNRAKALSQIDFPVFQQFYKMLQGIYYNVDVKIRNKQQQITDILSQIEKEEGVTGEKMFDKIINRKTGNLIPKLSSKWFDDVRNNVDVSKYFDKTAYETFEKEKLKEWLDKNPYYSDNTTKINNQKSFYKRFYGSGNPSSKFYKLDSDAFAKSGYLNENYEKYVRNKDTGLAKLYRLYEEINTVARQSGEYNVRSNYLPFITKSNSQVLLEGGYNKIIPNALDSISLGNWENYQLDANGNKIYKVPLKFYKEFKNENDRSLQSYDLGKNLIEWTKVVYTNQYMQEAEGSAKLLQYLLSKSKQVIKNPDGSIVKDASGNFRTVSVNENETFQQFREYVEEHLYGVQSQSPEISIFGSNISLNKVVKKVMSYVSGVAIGGNIMSALSGVTGGFANMIAVGAKGNHFTNKQVGKAVTLFGSGDAKIRSIMSYFDIDNNTYDVDANKKYTVNKLSSILSWDKVFTLQSLGDKGMQNTTLLAMLQNYTVDNGGLIKKTESNTNQKSLLDLIEIKDDKLVFPVSDFEIFKFRDKVKSVNSEIIGTTSDHNKSLMGNTLLGAAALQFRRWMLPIGVTRFGSLSYDIATESYNIGKYRSSVSLLFDKKIISMINELIKGDKIGYTEAKLYDLYKQQLEINPDLTYEQFRSLYIQNLKSTGMELTIYLAVAALLMSMDDDDKSPFEKFTSQVLARTSRELSFWFNPFTFTDLVRSPFPVMSTLTTLMSFLGTSVILPFEYLIMDDAEFEKEIDSYAKKGINLTLGASAYYKFIKLMEEDEK